MVENIEGNNYQLFEFGPGNCMGETSIIGIQPHTLSTMAIGEVEMDVIPRKALLEFIRNFLACSAILGSEELIYRLFCSHFQERHQFHRYPEHES